MSILHDYLSRADFGPANWEAERKAQLGKVQVKRGRPVLVVAARLATPPGISLPIDITFSDLLPFHDLLSTLQGDSVDVVLETPGGDGVVARDMVEMLHDRFKHVAFIIPGWAKSAGTIMAMGGHEILMGPTSALGPIDAQLQFEGKRFSAEALLEGMKALQAEVIASGKLNAAFIPMLQRISPGDLQNARNAMDFARVTVTEWLCKHKFKDWRVHRTTNPGSSVTPEQRAERASEIAGALSAHQTWKTHGRSLRIGDLRNMGLEIVDYGADPELFDPIQRYYVMLRLFLDSSDAYKIVETVASQVVQRFVPPPAGLGGPIIPDRQAATSVTAAVRCTGCGNVLTIQTNFAPGQPLSAGAVGYPSSEEVTCRCGNAVDLRPLRAQVERDFGRPILVGSGAS